jgi:hypothetical protein
MKELRKAFQTPEYAGIWHYFDGDRMAYRRAVQAYLRAELNDAEGSLVVDEHGPHWKGAASIELSYSHSAEASVLVFSKLVSLKVTR